MNYPFLGKGVAFPFRISQTGGIQMTEGDTDNLSVALQYIYGSWAQNDLANENHIAESISNILLTKVGEHDNLPAYGSKLQSQIFEPNTVEFELLTETYLETSTTRWEKRVVTDAVDWSTSNNDVDQGISRATPTISFITQEVAGNLVAPFVTVEQARTQEYPSADIDSNRHDYQSRYYQLDAFELDGIKQLRLVPINSIPIATGDTYYKVLPTDTWMLIANKRYGDVRLWQIIARAYVDDQALLDGASLEDLDPYNFPSVGQMIRIPSTVSVLMKKVI